MNRKFNRRNLCTLVFKDLNIISQPLGFTNNISESGIALWVNNTKLQIKDNTFSIRLMIPEKSNIDSDINLELQVIWSEITLIENYIKLGCKYKNISDEQHEKLTNLLTYLDKSIYNINLA
ncbi:MAG: PilZ domain-containing protein [Spirochaetota bacterium]|nr:PilZ domain-containing protein [Spirochaetota bacterium]